MLSQYGVQSSLSGTSPANGNTYNIALSPLFFVRGGWINSNGANKFYDAGESGYYWSFQATSGTNYAYFLYLGNSYINPSASGADRYRGHPLRCLISTP